MLEEISELKDMNGNPIHKGIYAHFERIADWARGGWNLEIIADPKPRFGTPDDPEFRWSILLESGLKGKYYIKTDSGQYWIAEAVSKKLRPATEEEIAKKINELRMEKEKAEKELSRWERARETP